MDTRDEVKKEMVTKINGQPTYQDVTMLEKELIAIAAIIPTTLRGGGHGHAGTIIEPAKYFLMTRGTAFTAPANPGNYPAGLAANAAAGTQAREGALHKELVAQFEILSGAEQVLKDIIIKAVESNNLLEIEDETLVFKPNSQNQVRPPSLQRSCTRLCRHQTLLAERDQEWDAS